MSKVELQKEALQRAKTSASLENDLAVMAEFAERGIEANPREDVFTYNAWLAQGRQVMKGEKGVRITTWIKTKDKETGEYTGKMFARTVSVFHISQTTEAETKAA